MILLQKYIQNVIPRMLQVIQELIPVDEVSCEKTSTWFTYNSLVFLIENLNMVMQLYLVLLLFTIRFNGQINKVKGFCM